MVVRGQAEGAVEREAAQPQTSPAPARFDPQSLAEVPFGALLEAAPDAIVIVDKAGHIVSVNGQAERLFGYQRAELIGQALEILLPEHLRAVHVYHRAAYAARPHTRPMGSGLDLAARRKDGSTFPVEISLSAIQAGAMPLVTSIIRDVTDRRRAEQELAEQAKTLREQADLLELTHDAIIVRSWDGTITFWNRGAEEMYGWPRVEALGQIVHRLLQTRFPIALEELETALEQNGRWEGELIHTRRDGTQVVVSSRQVVQRDRDGRPSGVLEINNDITDRKRAADELERLIRQRTAHLDALLQFSQELLTAHGLDGVLQRAMRQAMRLAPAAQLGAIYLYNAGEQQLVLRASAGFSQLPDFRRPADLGPVGHAFASRRVIRTSSADEWIVLVRQVMGGAPRRLLDALHLAEPPTGMIAIPLLAHDEAVGVLMLLRVAGEGSFVGEARSILEGLANLTGAAIFEARSVHAAAALTGQVARLEEQQRAMAERMSSAEAAMLQSARLAAVGQLAASVAHEINNPLYATRNCLYLLEQDLSPEQRESSYLALARDQLTRIAGIIERMREFYRPARGEMQPYDLNSLLENTLALARLQMRQGAIKVIFTPSSDLVQVVCDGDQLRQVFLNLILNAVDAMPEGGTLTVRTAQGVTVVVIEVQDTGIGIPEDVRARLFDPFFTTKATGTGLGLSISAHIVTQHGGQIEVDSAPGHGTTFRVVLPAGPA